MPLLCSDPRRRAEWQWGCWGQGSSNRPSQQTV